MTPRNEFETRQPSFRTELSRNKTNLGACVGVFGGARSGSAFADFSQPVSDLPSLPAVENGEEILADCNDNSRTDARDRCFHLLFADQSKRSPQAVAVTSGSGSLTYRELNSRANRLAWHLHDMGVAPEVLVAVCLPRSPELVVALLAVMKAGGAYVPLDPLYPSERLGYFLSDSAAPVLITSEVLRGRFDSFEGQVVHVDRDADTIALSPDTDPPEINRSGPENVAYVMYTSGSTGRPKGAMILHRGLSNYLLWAAEAYKVAEGKGSPVHSSVSFDLTVTALFTPLLVGRQVDLLDESLGVDQLAEAFRRQSDYSLVKITPAHLQLLGRQLRPEEVSGRTRMFVIGGEQLTAEHVAFWREHAPETTLVNEYGPTETVVGCCVQFLPREGSITNPISIGRPIAGTKLYVLDPSMRPVPTGVTGELYIGGVGVARGYLGRPDLTAQKFIADPFDGRPGARLYRSGDLARWLPNGELEYLGRIDRQMKIRGFRIEPGEIEATLEEHSGVAEAVVVLREDRPGDERLVAYLIPREEGASGGELREHLRRRLPEYMIPSAFVSLAAMPLTNNGKLDRAALPDPDSSRREEGPAYVAPRSPAEEILATIWQEVLGIERVGIHDQFFDLGGHSLLAARVTARAGERLGVEISARALFDTPTIAELAEQIAHLPLADSDVRRPLIRHAAHGPFPLSFAQQRLWFLDRLEGRLSAYNLPSVARLHGELDVESLRRAFEAIVTRHEPLRTTFHAQDGRPEQRIHPPARFELAFENLSDLEPDRRESLVSERVRQEADRPFDLERDLTIRASLLRLADDEHLLLVTMHHISSDGWSMTVFWNELSEFYSALRNNVRATLPALSIRYADYAVWQRTMLEGDRLERLLSYWRASLDRLPTLDLPADRPSPSTQSYRGASHEFLLPAQLCGRLKERARASNATLNMLLLGAFQLLLMRHSGQEDIAVGVPVAGRGRSELEGLIGFFVNTLVLRVDLSGNPTFRELLSRVRTVSLAAYDHQDLPFEQLVERLRPERQMGRGPLVRVIFQLMEFPPPAPRLAGLKIDASPVPGEHTRFDLELTLQPKNDGLIGAFVYRTDLFDESTISRLSGHFLTLLEGIVAEPDQRVHALPLLTEAERRRIEVDWNDTTTAYPRDRCVHQLFEDQAARFPGALALVCGDRSLTYGQMNARANQLARRLRAMGVTAETRVGLRLKRSPEMIVAILGILKAGGAYAPLSVDDPEERLRKLTEDAGIVALITDGPLARGWTCPGVPTVLIDEVPTELDRLDDTNLPPVTSATSLACVMYTSGSTGEPKGVLIEHRSIARLVYGVDYATFGPDRVFLQLASLAFDASTFEIWGALLHGAKLVQAPDGPTDLEVLGPLIATHGVTTLWLTAGLFNAIVESRPLCLAGVREILTGGEALSAKHVRMAYESIPGRPRIINGYGPTESTTFACCHPIEPAGLEGVDNIPIGRPIGNTRAYVLDSHGQLVAVGLEGELYLGGDGLARGYLNRPEATADRFVTEVIPNERLYRTGDRVRWRADGLLEFLGRVDNQVKLRGFRIELGEIETALSRHPAIRQAVAMVREDRPGDRRLVAYLVVNNEATAPDDKELQDFLSLGLPDHMVPSAFVRLAQFPLNANGKVDRKALPAPRVVPFEEGPSYVAPRNEAEVNLAAIWSEVLGVESVGVHDDFFDLGGHSLLAIRLLARIETELGVKLPISTVFRAGTVELMARWVEHREESPSITEQTDRVDLDDRVVTLQPNGTNPPAFVIPGLNGHVIALRDLALLIGEERPIHGLQPTGHDVNLLDYPTLEKLASELIKDMKRVASTGPYYLLGFSAGGQIAYEIACQLKNSGEEVGFLGLLDSHGPGYGGLLPLRKRLVRHLQKIWRLESRERFRYLLERGQAILGRVRRVFVSSRRPIHTAKAEQSTADQQPVHTWSDLHSRYTPGPYDGDVDLFSANKPNWIGSNFEDPTMGWGSLVRGTVVLHRIPGNHLDIIRLPWAHHLAVEIRKCLNRR